MPTKEPGKRSPRLFYNIVDAIRRFTRAMNKEKESSYVLPRNIAETVIDENIAKNWGIALEKMKAKTAEKPIIDVFIAHENKRVIPKAAIIAENPSWGAALEKIKAAKAGKPVLEVKGKYSQEFMNFIAETIRKQDAERKRIYYDVFDEAENLEQQ